METIEKFILKGKVAIVTGATRGLGQGIAIGLAGAGADIVGVGRSDHSQTREKIESLGRRYLELKLDVGEETTPELVVQKTVEHFGKVDILVNAAGITRRVMAIDISRKDWQDVLDVNLTALFFMCQAVARQFIKQMCIRDSPSTAPAPRSPASCCRRGPGSLPWSGKRSGTALRCVPRWPTR